MEYRLLGRSGLKVSALSFGTMTFGGIGSFANAGQTRGADARRLIDMCLDKGVNLFDTADVYSNGQAEEILSEALGQKREHVLIASKGFAPTGTGPNDIGASRHHLIKACEASLRRLKTDYIDLYQVHNLDSLTPPEETLRALDDLVRAGKVRYIGSSNFSGWQKMKAIAVSDRLGLERYISQQIQYSLLRRDSEDELLPIGIDQGVGALVWGALASGYLSGKFRPGGSEIVQTRLDGEHLGAVDTDRARNILTVMDDIASARPGVSISQIALNWVVRKKGIASVVIGARAEQQLVDNLKTAEWSLTDIEMRRLDEVSALPLRYPYSHHHSPFGAPRNPLS